MRCVAWTKIAVSTVGCSSMRNVHSSCLAIDDMLNSLTWVCVCVCACVLPARAWPSILLCTTVLEIFSVVYWKEEEGQAPCWHKLTQSAELWSLAPSRRSTEFSWYNLSSLYPVQNECLLCPGLMCLFTLPALTGKPCQAQLRECPWGSLCRAGAGNPGLSPPRHWFLCTYYSIPVKR